MKEYQWAHIDNFTPREFHNSSDLMDYEFVKLLDDARRVAGIPFTLTSTFREGDLVSAHGHGLAVDIRCPKKGHSEERMKIVSAALFVGFKRIGIYDKHIHLDTFDRHPEKWMKYSMTLPMGMWWGVSK